jgi:hypothetical protein
VSLCPLKKITENALKNSASEVKIQAKCSHDLGAPLQKFRDNQSIWSIIFQKEVNFQEKF